MCSWKSTLRPPPHNLSFLIPISRWLSFLYPLRQIFESLIVPVHLPIDQALLGQVSIQSTVTKEAGSCNMSMASWTDPFNDAFCWGLALRGGSTSAQDFQQEPAADSNWPVFLGCQPAGEQFLWILPQRAESILDLCISENTWAWNCRRWADWPDLPQAHPTHHQCYCCCCWV